MFIPLTPRVKPWVIQTFLTFDYMERTVKSDHHWKVVEQYFTVALFVFQFHPVCNFGNFNNFGLGTVRSKGINQSKTSVGMIT